MVVAGINHGANLGMMSSTPARSLPRPRDATWLPPSPSPLVGKTHFATAAHYAVQLVKGLMKHPARRSDPQRQRAGPALEQIKGIRVTRLGNRHPAESVIRTEDPRGQSIYWIGPPGSQQDAGDGRISAAIEQGYVSITPA